MFFYSRHGLGVEGVRGTWCSLPPPIYLSGYLSIHLLSPMDIHEPALGRQHGRLPLCAPTAPWRIDAYIVCCKMAESVCGLFETIYGYLLTYLLTSDLCSIPALVCDVLCMRFMKLIIRILRHVSTEKQGMIYGRLSCQQRDKRHVVLGPRPPPPPPLR
jgi:hypothetical protein